MKKVKTCKLAALLAVVLAATSGLGEITLTDQAGRQVTLPAPPARVASIYGIATWYVYALGASDLLVAAAYIGLAGQAEALVAKLDPGFSTRPRILSPNVDLEQLLVWEADLVLGSVVKHADLALLLEEVGVPIILYQAERWAAIREATWLTAQALDRPEAGRQLLHYLDGQLARVQEALAALPPEARPRVLFCGTDPLRVASGAMFQTQLIELAGGESVTSELPGYWQNVDLEQVLVWDPQVILIAPYGPVTPKEFLEGADWQTISAVRAGRVYKLPRLAAPWDIPVPEAALGLLWLAHTLHPDLFPLDLAAEVDFFYRNFYHWRLPEEVLTRLGEE